MLSCCQCWVSEGHVIEENKAPDLLYHLSQPFRVMIQFRLVGQKREPYSVSEFSYHYLDSMQDLVTITLGIGISEGKSNYQVLCSELIRSFSDTDSPPDLSSLGGVGRGKEIELLYAHLLYCLLDNSIHTYWVYCC